MKKPPSLRSLVRAAAVDKVPPGWLTKEQMARGEGYTAPRCFDDTLRRALALGFVEQKEFRVRWGNQERLRPHYRRLK